MSKIIIDYRCKKCEIDYEDIIIEEGSEFCCLRYKEAIGRHFFNDIVGVDWSKAPGETPSSSDKYFYERDKKQAAKAFRFEEQE